MNFSNSYIQLDNVFYEKIDPIPVKDPQLLLWNSALAEQLVISDELQQDSDKLAQVFSGNQILPGSEPIAAAYAGHQFGHFNPQLGDGRAHLIGEVLDPSGKRWDIQLKGSGRTRYSRGGDGRCAIGPAVREFIMSEAMHALGVPTARCLAVVTTGEMVFRETAVPGAVVTRVASSHLRVGSFEFFAARSDLKALDSLVDYTIQRHYPELQEEEGPQRYGLLLDKVIGNLIHLVVEWMRVGFIHGVMNTDNTSLSGETIDFGPCAMMGTYDPETVYSSIDTAGRYAFGNQPNILHWNVARFAECLLPLIDSDPKKAVEQVEHLIDGFSDRFNQAHKAMMARKLGFTSEESEDRKLIYSILDQLKEKALDYTVTFDLLTRSLNSEEAQSQIKEDLGETFDLWRSRLDRQVSSLQEVQQLMQNQNPVVIPRNHHVEAILESCEETGMSTSAEAFLQVLRSPYEVLPQTSKYQDRPADDDRHYRTFCGT